MRTLVALLLLLGSAWAISPKPKPADRAAPLSQLPGPVPVPDGDKAAFEAAEAALQRFEALRFDMPKGADMATWTTAVTAFMQTQAQQMSTLQAQYQALAARATPEYAVPALVRVGEVVERFASNLTSLPMPADLPPEAQKQMLVGLEQAADGLRQMAQSSYRQAVDRAAAGGVKGEWVEFARGRLALLDQTLQRAR